MRKYDLTELLRNNLSPAPTLQPRAPAPAHNPLLDLDHQLLLCHPLHDLAHIVLRDPLLHHFHKLGLLLGLDQIDLDNQNCLGN